LRILDEGKGKCRLPGIPEEEKKRGLGDLRAEKGELTGETGQRGEFSRHLKKKRSFLTN